MIKGLFLRPLSALLAPSWSPFGAYLCYHVAKRAKQRHCGKTGPGVVAGRAAAAAIYPDNLCRAICRGLASQLRADRGLMIDTPSLCVKGLRSLNLLCREASGMGLTCQEPPTGTASHVWGRQDSSDKAPPIDRERGEEGKCESTVFQEVEGTQQELSIGEYVIKMVGKTDGEVIDARHSLQNMLNSVCCESGPVCSRCKLKVRVLKPSSTSMLSRWRSRGWMRSQPEDFDVNY